MDMVQVVVISLMIVLGLAVIFCIDMEFKQFAKGGKPNVDGRRGFEVVPRNRE